MTIDDTVQDTTNSNLEEEIEKTFFSKIVEGTKNTFYYVATLVGCYSISGFAPIAMAAGFTIGETIKRKRAKIKMTLKEAGVQGFTGAIVGLAVRAYYHAYVTTIPIIDITGKLLRAFYAALFFPAFNAIHNFFHYVAGKYSPMKFIDRLTHPVEFTKELYQNAYKGKYLKAVKNTFKYLGIILPLNAIYNPQPVYGIPFIGAMYRGFVIKPEKPRNYSTQLNPQFV